MNFNYKIILSILLSLILGYVIYIYFFRKPVLPGEKLKDIQAQQQFLQKELLLPSTHSHVGPVPVEEGEDDNLTRESLYEEILKLNVLKNPVDFLFKFNMNDMQDMQDVFSTNHQKQSSRIEEYQDELEVQDQDQEDSLEEKTVEYPKETEAFGNLELSQEEELSKKIFSDMINMDRELKGNENKEEITPVKKKIAIKKKL